MKDTTMKQSKRYNPTKHPKNTARLFQNYEDDKDVVRSQIRFLNDVWDFWEDIGNNIHTFLAFRSVATGRWFEHPIDNGGGSFEALSLLTKYNRWEYDQYFCPNPFFMPSRKRQFALPTRFGWCDMDESEPESYGPWPSLVWETSPDRYQALWSWDKTHKPSDAERFSKALAYRYGGDQNGWTITKMLRLIGSVNHKPSYDEPYVETISWDWTKVVARPLPLDRDRFKMTHSFLDVTTDPTRYNREKVRKRYAKNLHPKARTLMGNRKAYEPNNSAQIFHMVAALHEAGANTDEIACVLWTSPYFVEKHGQNLRKLNEEIARILGKLEADE